MDYFKAAFFVPLLKYVHILLLHQCLIVHNYLISLPVHSPPPIQDPLWWDKIKWVMKAVCLPVCLWSYFCCTNQLRDLFNYFTVKAIIAPDKVFFLTKKFWYFSYFSTKTYVVGAH